LRKVFHNGVEHSFKNPFLANAWKWSGYLNINFKVQKQAYPLYPPSIKGEKRVVVTLFV